MLLSRTARQCTAPLRSLFSGWGSAPIALQGSSLSESISGQSPVSETSAVASFSSNGSLPSQHAFHSRAQVFPSASDQQAFFNAPQHSSRFPDGNLHGPSSPANRMLQWSVLGGVRGAKTAAPLQKSGAKMSKQQLLRQKRRGPDDGPVVEQPGIVHVVSTKNNTIITLTDEAGNAKAWSSAGEAGFKGARKATSYAAEAAAGKLAITAMRLGFRTVRLRVRGLGRGKQSAIKTLARTGLNVTQIDECTPIPHNGCRPPAKRRT